MNADVVKDKVHAEIFKKTGGAVYNPPLGAIHIEMGFDFDFTPRLLACVGNKAKIFFDASELEDTSHIKIGLTLGGPVYVPCRPEGENGPGKEFCEKEVI